MAKRVPIAPPFRPDLFSLNVVPEIDAIAVSETAPSASAPPPIGFSPLDAATRSPSSSLEYRAVLFLNSESVIVKDLNAAIAPPSLKAVFDLNSELAIPNKPVDDFDPPTAPPDTATLFENAAFLISASPLFQIAPP